MAAGNRRAGRQGAKRLALVALLLGMNFTSGCVLAELMPLLGGLFAGGPAAGAGGGVPAGGGFGGESPGVDAGDYGVGVQEVGPGPMEYPPAYPPVIEAQGVEAPTIRGETVSPPSIRTEAPPVPEKQAPTTFSPTTTLVNSEKTIPKGDTLTGGRDPTLLS